MRCEWGAVKTQVLVLRPEIVRQLKQGKTLKQIYDAFIEGGRLHAGMTAFYEHARPLRDYCAVPDIQSLVEKAALRSPAKPSPHHDIFERPLKRGASSASSKDANAPSDAQSDDTAAAAASSSASDRSTHASSSQSPSTSASERSGPRIATAAPSTLNWDASPEAVARAMRKVWGDDDDEEEAGQEESASTSQREEVAS